MVLVTHARKVLRQLDAAQSDLDELADGRRGALVVGAFPTVASSFLPEVIDAFTNEYPNINLVIRSARFRPLLEGLERGRLHICFLYDHAWRPFDAEGVRSDEVYREPYVVLVSKHHHLADRHEINIAELADEDWIVRADQHPAVEVLDHATISAGFRPKIAFHSNDYQEVQAMVSVGIGVALVPASAVAVKHPDIRVLSLGRRAPERRILITQRDERVYSTAETAFMSILRRVQRERRDSREHRAVPGTVY